MAKASILGIFPSLGGSVESQRKDRREGLFLNYYLPHYLKQFEKIYYFSYSKEAPLSDSRIQLCENKKGIHRYLYALLIPLIYRNEIKQCSLLRVMHLTGVIPAIISKFLYGKPFVTTYGYDYVRFAQIEGHPIKAILLKFLIPLFLKLANGVIVTTEELKSDVERLIGRTDKIRLVPNGVDTSEFKTERNSQSNGEFKMLFVGRLERQKNIPFLLDVLSGLQKKQKVKLTIVGAGSLESELKSRVSNEKLPVEFKGPIAYEAIRIEHAYADCFISTSLAEGHPKALIEAMSSGLLCAVSDCAGNRTLIKNEANGLLIDNRRLDIWVNALENICNHRNLGLKLGSEARRFAVDNLDLSLTLKRETQFLSEFL